MKKASKKSKSIRPYWKDWEFTSCKGDNEKWACWHYEMYREAFGKRMPASQSTDLSHSYPRLPTSNHFGRFVLSLKEFPKSSWVDLKKEIQTSVIRCLKKEQSSLIISDADYFTFETVMQLEQTQIRESQLKFLAQWALASTRIKDICRQASRGLSIVHKAVMTPNEIEKALLHALEYKEIDQACGNNPERLVPVLRDLYERDLSEQRSSFPDDFRACVTMAGDQETYIVIRLDWKKSSTEITNEIRGFIKECRPNKNSNFSGAKKGTSGDARLNTLIAWRATEVFGTAGKALTVFQDQNIYPPYHDSKSWRRAIDGVYNTDLVYNIFTKRLEPSFSID